MINYRRNIPANYLFVFFSNVQFTSGLWMIFLAKQGFSLIELGLLESIFHISSMVFEIPSGALADLIGRKYCRLGGRLLFLISLFIMYLAGDFAFQAIGFAVCAFGYNLESGAGEAFTYDTLKILGEEGRYKRVAGFVEVAFQSGMVISFALGGLMASTIGYFYVFLFSGCSVIVSILTGLSFHEVRVDNPAEDKSPADQSGAGTSVKMSFRGFLRILADSLKLLKTQPRIMFLIVFSETILTFTTSLFFYIQNYFKESGREESYIGLIYAAASILSALSSVSAAWIEKRTGEKKLFIMLLVLLTVCLGGIALTPWKAAFFIVTGFIEGVTFIVISDYLNRMIPSDIRATVLSFQSMTFSILMVVLFPVIGMLAELYSFTTAFMVMAVVSAVLTAAYGIIAGIRSKSQLQS